MNPKNFYFALPGNGRPQPFSIQEQRAPNYQWYDANRARARGGHPINKITTSVIHATSGWATQHALDRWKEVKASAHWIIPDEDEPQHGKFVWSVISESLAAYHVKDKLRHPDLGDIRRINDYSLGIEIVNTQEVQNYTDPYSKWQVAQAALLVRFCWAKYPNLKHVISHARIDPERRDDPGANFPWAEFKELVLSERGDPAPEALASMVKPITEFPALSARFGGGCCP